MWFAHGVEGRWRLPRCLADACAPVLAAHQCGHGIRPGDQGLLLPYLGGPLPGYEPLDIAGVPHLAYHLACFFDEVGIRGTTHV
jgi:hypothetical protein